MMDLKEQEDFKHMLLLPYIVKGKEKMSLKDLIHVLDKEILYDQMRLVNSEDIPLKEQEELLFSLLTDEEYVREILINMSEKEYELLPKLLKKGTITEVEEVMSCLFFIKAGLMYLYEKNGGYRLFMPQEIKACIHTILSKKNHISFEILYIMMQGIYHFCEACVNLYGAISLEEAGELFKSYFNVTDQVEETLEHAIITSYHGHFSFGLMEDYLVSVAIEEEGYEAFEVLKQRSSARYHITELEDFLEYADEWILPDNRAYEDMSAFIYSIERANDIEGDLDERVDDILSEIHGLIQFNYPENILFDMKRMKFDLSDVKDEFLNLFLNCMNHTRLWAFYGHTRAEVGETLSDLPELISEDLQESFERYIEEEFDEESIHLYEDIEPGLSLNTLLWRLTDQVQDKLMAQYNLKRDEDDYLVLDGLKASYEAALKHMNDDHIKMLQTMVMNGGYMSLEASVQYIRASEFLKELPMNMLLFPGLYKDEPGIYMPQELLEWLQGYKWTDNGKTSKTNTLIRDLTIGMCYMYGLVTKEVLFTKLETLLGSSVSEVFLEKSLAMSFAIHDAVNIVEDLYVFVTVEDYEGLLSLQSERPELEFKDYTKQELLKASKPQYFYRSNKAEQLIKLLKKEVGLDKEASQDFAAYFVDAFNNGTSIDAAIIEMDQYFGQVPQEFMNLVMPYIVGIYNGTPQKLLKGHSPNDLHKEPSIIPLNVMNDRQDNVIDFSTRKKIGRNDPCPCGSGRKYKQCCGK